jgi:NAD+ synthase (glutamine-hydrolysing)
VKVYLAQINTTVGDFSGNGERIKQACADAAARGCDVILLPELATTGYPPRDLLFLSDFLKRSEKVVESVCDASGSWPDLSVFLGCPCREGGKLYNSCAVIIDGKIIGYLHKTLLPTYDVFDERRYFSPAKSWLLPSWKGVKIGLTICEDLWDEGYETKVVPRLVELGAQVIFNISSSPYNAGKWNERYELLRRHALTSKAPIAYCNLFGAESELIYDGGSMVVGRDGRLVAAGRCFAEDALIVEYDSSRNDFVGTAEPPAMSFEEEVFNALVVGTRDFHHKQGFTKCVIGLSGGIDSSLVAAIAAQALGPENVLGVAMPSRMNIADSLEDARVLARKLGIEFAEVPIEDSVRLAEERYARAFGLHKHPETRENLQARERGKILMEISNDQKRLLLATGNKTEYALGYATLYGDMCGALAVIGDLNKTEVYAVSRWVNECFSSPIPERVLTKKPSAELAPGQVDPFNYDIVSPLVDELVEEQASAAGLAARGYPDEEVRRCVRLLFTSEYKRRQAAPVLKISKRAFGRGRQMPLVNKYIPE